MSPTLTTHRKTLTQGGYRCIDQRIDLEFPLSLWQRGPHDYVVLYGLERHECHTRAQAMLHYGRSLFHALACAGKLKQEAEIEA